MTTNLEHKIDILSLTKEELSDIFAKVFSLPQYRAGQVYSWLHRGITSFSEMTDLSLTLRKQLDERFYILSPECLTRLVSKIDGTVKYLFRLHDGNLIESVLMRYRHGNTMCISTQAGCRMGCGFCASAEGGLKRNLAPSEMLAQVMYAMCELDEKIGGVVLMGMGEPLDNYDNTVKFLRLISSPDGLNMSSRNISLSTCGIADKISALACEGLPVTLSVSLHSADNDVRSSLMPVNRKWNIDALMESCREYIRKTKRRISFEYILIDGVNNAHSDAKNLAKLLRGIICHVNLIPANPTEKFNSRTDTVKNRSFCAELTALGINATIRRRLGADINAACGQLKGEWN